MQMSASPFTIIDSEHFMVQTLNVIEVTSFPSPGKGHQVNYIRRTTFRCISQQKLPFITL